VKTEKITFDEFIDCITEGDGDQIKKDLKKLASLKKIDKKKRGYVVDDMAKTKPRRKKVTFFVKPKGKKKRKKVSFFARR